VSEIPLAQRLLVLFTSPACAEAIAGDFAETRRDGGVDRGSVWFWRQVLTTAIALCGSALTAAPLASVRTLATGCLLFGSLALAGFAPVALVPPLLGTPAGWVVLSLTWWSGAFFTGFTLVRLSPARGMAASVVLALMGEASLLALSQTVLQGGVRLGPAWAFYSITAFIAVPLLVGSMVARRGIVGAGGATELQR
jgi:hypothetical protein